MCLSVCRCSQTAGRNSCSIVSGDVSISVRIDWQYMLSRVGVSVRPRFFVYAKNIQNYRDYRPPCTRDCLFQWSTDRPFMASGTGEKRAYLRHGWAHIAHVTATTWMVTAVGWRDCARARVCACVCGEVRTCVRAWCVCRIDHDNIIWPRLIMIIIKTVILYLIQITHTDDFPSTGPG